MNKTGFKLENTIILKTFHLLSANHFLFRFPFDKQNCAIELVFSDYEEAEVAWILLAALKQESLQENSNPSWNIVKENLEKSQEELYNLGEMVINKGNLSKLIYTVTLKRQPRTAIVYVICPTVAISTFNIISFVLPTGEGRFNSYNLLILIPNF